MTALPEKFMQAMKKQLPPDEWEAFFAVYGHSPQKGLRVNALKISAGEFANISPFALRPVPWEKNGYYAEEEKIGSHPYHFAGLYYSQEPSAMCAAPLLDAKRGERVLDLCSAPGGKGTQLAAAMAGEGILVLNEPVFSRAQILSQNVERLGVKNAVVLSEMPAKLAKFFGGYFDKILVDAPCSGEGMFRKNAKEALGEWSEENVSMCAARQKEILGEATKMLAPRGKLVYSTCTFSEAEDEGQVSDYLQTHPEMRLVESQKLYPHKVLGEGHFAALFEKVCEPSEEVAPSRFFPPPLLRPRVSRESEKTYREFERQALKTPVGGVLHEAGGMLYALPEGVFDWKELHVLRAGIRLGEIKNGRFEPSHSLAMCLKKDSFKSALNLSLSDVRTEKFLRGETVTLGAEKPEKGWCGVCVDGFPIGWGKVVGDTVKNHIPKGLRKFS